MVNKFQNSEKKRAYIALGSNLGIPLRDLKAVPQFLVENVSEFYIELESISPYFQTPAFPKGSGPDFVNAVFAVKTDAAPEKLLQNLHKVEAEFGRERPYRWAPRTLDLDLLFVDDAVVPDEKTWRKWAALSVEEAQNSTPDGLILPHPRAHERSFVLGPMRAIAPDFVHPVLAQSIEQLWQGLPRGERNSLEAI